MAFCKSLNGLIIGKCFFNADPNKPAQEVLFSRKKKVEVHLTIYFNNIQVERTSYQNHVGILLHEQLNFKQYIDSVIPKLNTVISVIKKLRHYLPRKSLLKIYKAFLRPLIDYGDVIFDQSQNESFSEKLESVQHKAALGITNAMQGTSRDKIYQELGLELLKSRRWYKR